ncbi:STAS domain-containing protein [Streptomyces sp. NPDC058613]|uniref:STAS domain-containing protein n=1 Tax=unclassified Streptomyces TaxID=2593676 RepID=UPI003656B653
MPQSGWRTRRALHGPGRPVHVHRKGDDEVEVSLHGEIHAQNALLVGYALACLVDEAPVRVRIDLARAGELNSTSIGRVFFPLLAAARLNGAANTVQGTSPRTRAKLRELGLDRCMACVDTFA